jgi:aspartate racemase
MTKPVLGILGGMGPLASAEFLKTIYALNLEHTEQRTPVCILYSDPTIPDRTEAILNGREGLVVDSLVTALQKLLRIGVTKVVIACITMHQFLPKVPSNLRNKVISLVDLTIEQVLLSKQRALLLCTNGTRASGIFQRHDRWDLVEKYVVLASNDDQMAIHNLIYQELKTNRVGASTFASLEALLQKYQVGSFISGCTEIHLLTKQLMEKSHCSQSYRIVDPLLTLAKEFRSLVSD